MESEEYTRIWLSGFLSGVSCDTANFDKVAKTIPKEMLSYKEIKWVKDMIFAFEKRIKGEGEQDDNT